MVPITVLTKVFPYSYNKRTVIYERKQYAMIFGGAITIHKSQGSNFDYTNGDLDLTTDKGPNAAVVNKGQFYTLLSPVKNRDKVKLPNFDLSHIHSNEHAIAEMKRMKGKSNNCLFDWKHLLSILYGNKICLFNIRS